MTYLLFGLVIASYIILTFTSPFDPANRYHLTEIQTRLLQLTIVLPFVFFWTLIVRGAVKVHDYADKIATSSEGPGFKKLADGLIVLALGFMVPNILSSVRSRFILTDPELVSTMTIMNNYVNLGLNFLGMLLLYQASAKLLSSLGNHSGTKKNIFKALIPIIIIEPIFTQLALSAPNKIVPLNAQSAAAYYLPDILIVLTLIIPYALLWFLGLYASSNMNAFKDQIKGIIYKQAIGLISTGIFIIIINSIFLQLLTTAANLFTNFGLAPILLIVYLIVAVWGLGYVVISRGARRLTKIEEVAGVKA